MQIHYEEHKKQELLKEIERRKKEKEKEIKERGFNCIACQQYFQQRKVEKLVEDLARRTLQGDFGTGATRRNALGHLYPKVQNRINEMLGLPKKY